MPWDSVTVAAALDKAPSLRAHQILASEVATSGRIAVVDQGQQLVAGYTDNEERVIRGDLPLIVFGDHTRCVKFVDFPFVAGADGTKLLKPRDDLFEPRFFYYALVAANVPSRGYNRHFSLLKELRIPRPEKSEQTSIVAALDIAEAAVNAHERLLDVLLDLKRAALDAAFAPSATRKWHVERVDDVARLRSGGTPSRSKPVYWDGGTIPWVKTSEVNNCVIDSTEEHITELGLASSSATLFPAGTLLMAMYGQGVTRGKVALLGIDAATNQACVAFFPSERVSREFLYYLFQHRYEELRTYGHGANQRNLSAEIIKAMSIAYPDRHEQGEIVARLAAIDGRIALASRKRDLLHETFRTLLKDLLSQRLGVDQLHIRGEAH
jgi:type I restriction enzyme, S subunit